MITRSLRAANPLTLRLGRWRPSSRNPSGPRLSRQGFVIGIPVYAVPPRTIVPPPWRCRPVVDPSGHLVVTPAWATACFVPAYHRARAAWGRNTKAITTEVLHEVDPASSAGAPLTAAEHELRRRIAMAVAILLNAEGVPTHYPPPAVWTYPVQSAFPSPGPAWLVALTTGKDVAR